MRDFRPLKVWQKAHSLTLDVYSSTSLFPKSELYGLTSQLRRASASIPTNIAEGCGRDTEKSLKQFMQIAMGSASELDYLLVLSKDLGFLEKNSYEQLQFDVIEIKKMLSSFIVSLRTQNLAG
jgi:four helix bundle protein